MKIYKASMNGLYKIHEDLEKFQHFISSIAIPRTIQNIVVSDHYQPEACNFIKKGTLAQIFSREFWDIFKNTFFTEHLWWLLLNFQHWSPSYPLFPPLLTSF